jgi:methylmalonyl-CoA/ethylmalonyl-CoA epimerase
MEDSMSNDTGEAEQAVHLADIGQIAITVGDLARSKAFYQNILGMKFLFDAGAMAFFECGPVRLLIGASEKPVSGGGTILYFRVGDIQGTYARLSDQGVTFVSEPHLVAKMPDHDLWIAFLRDPDDNTLGLMSEVSPARSEPEGK